MDVEQALRSFTQQLEQAGIPSARLDCLILLEDVLHKDRAWLLSHPEHVIETEKLRSLGAAIERRSTHEPLAYIRQQTEFFGRTFFVNHHVLEPRPESESIIEAAKQAAKEFEKPVIIDVGTGSGALAITAKLEIPRATVLATDIDPHCLEVANRNAKDFKVEISFIHADLLQPSAVTTTPDIILANLPYVPDDFPINLAAKHEPKLAIFGGPDGLTVYQRMFDQIEQYATRPRFVITEAIPVHHEQLATIAKGAGYELSSTASFVQVFIFTQ